MITSKSAHHHSHLTLAVNRSSIPAGNVVLERRANQAKGAFIEDRSTTARGFSILDGQIG